LQIKDYNQKKSVIEIDFYRSLAELYATGLNQLTKFSKKD